MDEMPRFVHGDGGAGGRKKMAGRVKWTGHPL